MTGFVKVLTFACLFLFSGVENTPNQGTKEESQDGEFTVEIIREGTYVKFIFVFVEPKKYSHLTIEKNMQMEGSFRQCAYIDLKANNPAIVAKDKYPFSKYEDSYYRVRTVTVDQIERVYPPIRLPAATQLTIGE